MYRWITNLKHHNLRPEIQALEVTTHEQANQSEMRWMAHYMDQGAELLNAESRRPPSLTPKRTNTLIVLTVQEELYTSMAAIARLEGLSLKAAATQLIEEAISMRNHKQGQDA